jgi:hypothetical protein
MKMKKIIIKSIFYLFVPKVINLYFKVKNKRLFIFDIDNTITDTGSYLSINGELTERKKVVEMCSSLEIDHKMKEIINIISGLKDSELIFLTARSYYLYSTTNNWLKKELDFGKVNLIMVMNASDKLPIIKILSNSAEKLILFDDLTYGHEKGKLFYHKPLIEKIKKIKGIKYLGLDEIIKIKSGKINAEEIIK